MTGSWLHAWPLYTIVSATLVLEFQQPASSKRLIQIDSLIYLSKINLSFYKWIRKKALRSLVKMPLK